MSKEREKCCNQAMSTRIYTIRSDRDGWMFDVIKVNECKVCEARRGYGHRIDKVGKTQEIGKLTKADFIDKWNKRIRMELVHSDQNKPTRAMVHAGEKTRLMTRDTAEVYRKILESFGYGQR